MHPVPIGYRIVFRSAIPLAAATPRGGFSVPASAFASEAHLQVAVG